MQQGDRALSYQGTNEARQIAQLTVGIWILISVGTAIWIQVAGDELERLKRMTYGLGLLGVLTPPIIIAAGIIYGASIIAEAIENHRLGPAGSGRAIWFHLRFRSAIRS